MNLKSITLFGLALALAACNNAHEETKQTEIQHTTSSIFLADSIPQKVGSDYAFTEGPAADREGNVYFTDQPFDKIYKWNAESGEISLFSSDTKRANGLYINAENALFSCSDLDGEILKFDANGDTFEVAAASPFETRFNGPNDLWITSKGGIFFTDPQYKRPYWENYDELKFNHHMSLYYLPFGESTPVLLDSNFVRPNGIIGSETLGKLYVTDEGDGITYVYDLAENGKSISNKKLFCELGSDGMTLDERGNVYLTGKGVIVFDPDGKQIAHIPVNENWTANVTFAGKENNILFITASTGVYTLKMNVKGVEN